MKRKLEIKKSYLYAWVMFIVWFPMTSIIDTYSSWFNIIKLILCGCTILVGIDRRKPDYRYILLWAYFSLLVFSTYKQQNTRNLLLVIVYSIGILSIFYFFKHRSFSESIDAFYPIITFYIFLNTLTVFFTKNGLTQNAWGQANYLIGGKFSVLYLSLIWIAAYLGRNKNGYKRIKVTAILVALSLVSLKTDCSTGVFCLFVIWLVLMFAKIRNAIFRPFVIIGVTAGLNILLVAYNSLLQSGVAAYVVQNVLHRNLNLTGRTEIYDYFFTLIGENWLLGMGYNNTLISSSLGYLNAQNGFLDVIAKCGILGAIVFSFILIVAIITSYTVNEEDTIVQSIWPVFFSFIIASLVEISFNAYFFFILAIMFAKRKVSYLGDLNYE